MYKLEQTGVKFTNMAANNTAYIEGTFHYPCLFDTKDKFDRWSVAVTLEGDQVKHARNLNLRVQQNPEKYDGMPYVQLKSNYQPQVFADDGSEYSGPTRLANGTKGVVKISQKPYNNKYGTGVTTYMSAVKLTHVIEFVPDSSGGSSFDDGGDFGGSSSGDSEEF